MLTFDAESVRQDQIDWGSHLDPRGLLSVGQEYALDYADMRNQHTKIFLKEFPGKSFNSVWFDISPTSMCKLIQCYRPKPLMRDQVLR